MTRLYEEVLTRLEEMAMIVVRTLRTEAAAGSPVLFNPLRQSDGSEIAAVEIVRTAHGRGCYDYREGACFETDFRQIDLESQQ